MPIVKDNMESKLFQIFLLLAHLSLCVITARSDSPNRLSLTEEYFESRGNVYADDIEEARKFLKLFNRKADDLMYKDGLKNWAYETDLTDKNLQEKIEADLSVAEFFLDSKQNASFIKTLDLPQIMQRQISLIRRTADPTSKEMRRELREAIGKMTSIFGKAKIKKDKSTTKYSLSDLDDIMAKSRNRKELNWAWKGWRDKVGPPMKSLYSNSIDLLNIGAREHGWIDYGDFSQSDYEMGDDFERSLDRVWEEMEPLYRELHAYVRFRLKSIYNIPKSGSIPANLLGDMFAQNWENIFPLVKPSKNSKTFDVTAALKQQNYTVDKMFHLAERFFTSIGLEKMPTSFWKKSVLAKPPDKEMVCHASAWDISNKDVRIKMCTKVNQEHLTTIHHEMGHVEYFLAYKNLPNTFRAGANPGFHEAIGDVVSLSVATPNYLKQVGLRDSDVSGRDDYDDSISFLLNQALQRVAPIPYNLLVDKWRWRVYEGNITENSYNREWWKLRVKYQGVEPPVSRPANAFDAASKYHIGANVQYVAYFVSYILQFQLHKALCKEANFTGPLHLCSIYKSKAAGTKLKIMLEAGRSKPWPRILKETTGERELKAEAILEYFEPLIRWLKTMRHLKKYPIGWGNGLTKPVLQRKTKKYEAGQERSGILKTNSGDVSLQINIPSATLNELLKKGNMSAQNTETNPSNSGSSMKTPTLTDLAKLLNSAKAFPIKPSDTANATQQQQPNMNIQDETTTPSSSSVSNNNPSHSSNDVVSNNPSPSSSSVASNNPSADSQPADDTQDHQHEHDVSGLHNQQHGTPSADSQPADDTQDQQQEHDTSGLHHQQHDTTNKNSESLSHNTKGNNANMAPAPNFQILPLESLLQNGFGKNTTVGKNSTSASMNEHEHSIPPQHAASLKPSMDNQQDTNGESKPHNDHENLQPQADHEHAPANDQAHVPSAATERPHASFPSISVSQATPKENPKTAGVAKEQSNPLSAAIPQIPKQNPNAGNQIALLPVSVPGNVLAALKNVLNGTNSLDFSTLQSLAKNSTNEGMAGNVQNNNSSVAPLTSNTNSVALENNTNEQSSLNDVQNDVKNTTTENAEKTLEEANSTVTENNALRNTSNLVSEDSISHDPQEDLQSVGGTAGLHNSTGVKIATRPVTDDIENSGFRTTQNVMPCKRNDGKCLFGKVVTEGNSLPTGDESKGTGTISVPPSLLIQKILEHHVAEKSTPEAVKNDASTDNTTVENTENESSNSKENKAVDMDQLLKALTGNTNITTGSKTKQNTEIQPLLNFLNAQKNNETFPGNCSGLQKRRISLTFNCKDTTPTTPEESKDLKKKGSTLSISPAELMQKLLGSKTLKNEVNRKTIPSANVIKTSNGFQLNFDLNPKDKIPSEENVIKHHNPIDRLQHVNVYNTPKGMVVKPKSSEQLLKPLFVPVQNKDKIELGGRDSKSIQ